MRESIEEVLGGLIMAQKAYKRITKDAKGHRRLVKAFAECQRLPGAISECQRLSNFANGGQWL